MLPVWTSHRLRQILASIRCNPACDSEHCPSECLFLFSSTTGGLFLFRLIISRVLCTPLYHKQPVPGLLVLWVIITNHWISVAKSSWRRFRYKRFKFLILAHYCPFNFLLMLMNLLFYKPLHKQSIETNMFLSVFGFWMLLVVRLWKLVVKTV